MLTGFDLIFLAVLGLSGLAGALRGLIRVLVNLCSWVGAFLGAWILAPGLLTNLAPYLQQWGMPVSWHALVVYAALFVLILLTGLMLGAMLKRLIDAAGLKGADELLGFCFGLLRGGIIMLVATLVIMLSGFQSADWWKNSLLAPFLSGTIAAMKPYFSPMLADKTRVST